MVVITNEFLVMALIFVLVLSFSQVALHRFLKNKAASLLASVAISALSVFYLSYSQFEFIENIQGLTGALVLFLFPFVIALFFIYTSKINGLLRKIFWIFYGTVMLTLLQQTSTPTETASTIFLVVIVVTVIMVLFDTVIKNTFTTKKNLRFD